MAEEESRKEMNNSEKNKSPLICKSDFIVFIDVMVLFYFVFMIVDFHFELIQKTLDHVVFCMKYRKLGLSVSNVLDFLSHCFRLLVLLEVVVP